MNKIKIEICLLKEFYDKYIRMIQYICGKTELYAIIITDVDSTWIHTLKHIFERNNTEMHRSFH